MGRFLNADAYASTGQGVLGNNMFAYCGNNPVMFVDSTGKYYLTFGVETYGTLGNALRHYTGGGSISSTFSIATSKEESEKVIEREVYYWESGVYDDLEDTYATYKFANGVRKICNGIKITCIPEPTPVTDIIGAWNILHGLCSIVSALLEISD